MINSERTGQDWKDEAIALRTVLKPLADQRDELKAEVERLKVELAVKPLLEATPLLNQSHMDELAQANTIIHLETEVARLKAEATVINGYAESVKEERDECYELEVKYKRLLGVAEKFLEEMVNVNGDYPYINKTDLVKDTYQILKQIKK